MSKQANKKAIGAFVVASLVLAVAAIVVFGSGKFFAKRYQFVSFFHGSVKGLRIGAPVVFRGVQVGEVTKMMIYADHHDLSFEIPVIMEIDKENFKSIGPDLQDPKKYMQLLIKSGLRVQLQMQSLVTGQLVVNMDFFPDTPVKLVGGQKINIAKGVTEIPAIETTMQKLEENLEGIIKSVNKSLKRIESIVTSEETTQSLQYLNQSLKAVRDLARHLDEKVDPISANVDLTLKDAQKLLRNVDSHVDPIATTIQETGDAARPALNEIEKAFANIAALTGKGSDERQQLNRTLKELQGAARSIKLWAEYLERHPEALIRGKGNSKRR